MRGLIRRIFFYSLALFLATQLVSGISISGGLWQYLLAGLVLAGMMLILKPILQVLAFPFNMITFGFFSIIVNGIILFLLTVFVPLVHVTDFSIARISFAGFVTPTLHIPRLFGFALISVILSGLYSGMTWLIE